MKVETRSHQIFTCYICAKIVEKEAQNLGSVVHEWGLWIRSALPTTDQYW
jgi:hypothetical protein